MRPRPARGRVGLARALVLTLLSALTLGPAPGAVAQSAFGGMSAEQDLRQNPQPPRDLRAARRADGAVEILWAPPPEPPQGPLMYERGFTRYRVYRLADGRQTVLTDTTALSALDPAPSPGATYVVVTVQRDGREGARPDPVAPSPR